MVKNIFYGSLVLMCFIFLTCSQPLTKITGDFQLLPSPQHFEITGTSDLGVDEIKFYYSTEKIDLPVVGALLKHIQPVEAITNAQISISIDESMDLASEGYTLDINRDQISVDAKDLAGLLYAMMSLEQLIEDASDQNVNLPQCKIRDFPLLSYRAVHIDIKHHREKIEYYYKLMDRLAKFKVNAIIAEVEDKIKYIRQPEVGSADALSIDDWRELSEFALERNIEISPLVQGLGHASFILKHEKYKNLRDDPESDWAFNPLDPKSYDVQFDLYLDALDAMPHGKYLHVGGDEVHTTGRGSNKSPLELQLIWLNKVCQYAESQGRIPIFWDDMPLKHAGVYSPMFNNKLSAGEVDDIWQENEHKLLDFIDQFPKNCVYMRWNYQMPGTYGNLKAMDWFTSNGFLTMGATAGQTRWTLMPQNQSNIENIRSFALSSIDKNMDGLLLTLWDDDSPHFELYMRGIMAFAEYTWAGEKRKIEELKSAYRQRAFGYSPDDENHAFIDLLEEPVGIWKNVLLQDGKQRNSLVKMDLPILDGIIDLPDPNNKGVWSDKYADRIEKAQKMLMVCDSISEKIEMAKTKAGRNSYTLEIYEQVNELIKFSFQSIVALETFDNATQDFDAKETFNDLEGLGKKFTTIRSQFEEVYSKTRILTKPEGYLLDQDHHRHSANQTISFDWQFISEILFLEKLQAIK